jgi:hypothetical protein
MALIQEPWYRENCTRGLNIPGYTLYCAGGTDRPRACVLAGSMISWMLPGFSCRDLVAVLFTYLEGGTERLLVICSAYLLYDSEDPPPTKELEDLVRYCEEENLYLIFGCDSNAHRSAWGSTNCNDRVETLVEFHGASNLEILNRGNETNFCNGHRLEVIDITLGSFGLQESTTGWEVSSEPSLSDHRHILFTLRGSVPVRLIWDPRGTNWGSFRGDLEEVLTRGPMMNIGNEAGLGLAINCEQHALTPPMRTIAIFDRLNQSGIL